MSLIPGGRLWPDSTSVHEALQYSGNVFVLTYQSDKIVSSWSLGSVNSTPSVLDCLAVQNTASDYSMMIRHEQGCERADDKRERKGPDVARILLTLEHRSDDLSAVGVRTPNEIAV